MPSMYTWASGGKPLTSYLLGESFELRAKPIMDELGDLLANLPIQPPELLQCDDDSYLGRILTDN